MIKLLMTNIALATALLISGCGQQNSDQPAESMEPEADDTNALVKADAKPQKKVQPVAKPTANAKPKKTSTTRKPKVDLSNGLSEADFIALAGPPTGEVMAGGKKILSYDGVMVTVVDGRVEEIPPAFKQAVTRAKEELEKERLEYQEYRKKGLVRHNGKWVTPKERDRRILAARKTKDIIKTEGKAKPSGRQFKTGHVVKKPGGGVVDHSSMVRSGEVSVVLFYSNRRNASGTNYRNINRCKELAYNIHHNIRDMKGVSLRRINIDTLETPIAKQYHVTNIPEVRVFGKDTKMVGTPSNSFRTITEYIKFAAK